MIKDLAELKALKQRLKSRAEAALKAEQERREREREANLFRTSIGDVEQLRTAARVSTPPPRPQPIPHQRLADEARTSDHQDDHRTHATTPGATALFTSLSISRPMESNSARRICATVADGGGNLA